MGDLMVLQELDLLSLYFGSASGGFRDLTNFWTSHKMPLNVKFGTNICMGLNASMKRKMLNLATDCLREC